MTKADYMRIEEFLDERYLICGMAKEVRSADETYYRGALAAVEVMGFDWVRNENGQHRVFKG